MDIHEKPPSMEFRNSFCNLRSKTGGRRPKAAAPPVLGAAEGRPPQVLGRIPKLHAGGLLVDVPRGSFQPTNRRFKE